jgi:nitroreductase
MVLAVARGIGTTERAVLDRIPWAPARRLATAVVRAKLRLQFTGWLQYLLPTPAILGLALLGIVASLLAVAWLPAVFFVPAGLLGLVASFDVVTTKWKLRLPESRPPALDDLDPFDLLRARHSCRSFQTRPMSDDDRTALLAAVDRALALPTIGATTPRLEYIAAPLTVWPTVNASEFLVAIVPAAYDRTAIIDVGRTLQRVVMDVTRLGLATCWIGPGADQRSIAAHLGPRFDPEADHIVCVCAVGYRSAYIPLFLRLFNHRMSNTRLPLSELFFTDDALRHPIDPTTAPHDHFARVYEACRWAPSSYNAQPTRAVVETDANGELTAVRFFQSTASKFYAPVALGIWCANWEMACEALDVHGVFERVESGDEVPKEDVAWRRAPAP